MKKSLRISTKLLVIMVMVSLMLTSCALLPSTVANTIQNFGLSIGQEDITIPRAMYDRLIQYAELDEMMQIVEAYYYQEPDREAMMENAKRGLLYGLEDPYTFYYNPEQYSKMWEDDAGEYAGIGIQLMSSYETLRCIITRVYEGSPAFEAGVRKGDVLWMVEDLEVNAYTINDAVAIMRGEVGKPVKIQVLRDEEQLDFTVNRAMVHVNWVSSCMLDDSIGYIVLYEFAGDCSVAFEAQMNELIEKGAKGFVIDIRDNPGGWVVDAARLADIFLPDALIYYLENRYGEREYYKAEDGMLEMPLVVLINENSASASEILAGALQDHGKATIVGVKSFGKGIVQNVRPVGRDGAGMQVTAAQYYTPNGNVVHKVGISPDVEVSLPEGDDTLYEIGDLKDAQLNKAYEVLKEQMEKQETSSGE